MRAWLPRPTSVPIRPPTSRPATTVLRQRNVPEAIRSLSTLAKPDYVDLFTVTTGAAADRRSEQWARATLEDAAGFETQAEDYPPDELPRERRPSLDHVGGWKIGDRDDNWIRLEAASWFLTAPDRRSGRSRAGVRRHVHPIRPADGGSHLAAAVHRASPSDARAAALGSRT